MSAEQTLLIREDDDSTLVDRRFLSDADAAHLPSAVADGHPAHGLQRGAWVGLAGVAAVVSILAFVSILQHRELTSLRRFVLELRSESHHARGAETVPEATTTMPRDFRGEAEIGRERPPTESHASALLLTKQYRRALSVYRVLARQHPERAVYVDFVRVLEAKTGCFVDEGSCR